jgi:hypothetical protein
MFRWMVHKIQLSRLSEQLVGSESAILGAPDASTERIRLADRAAILPVAHPCADPGGSLRQLSGVLRRVVRD